MVFYFNAKSWRSHSKVTPYRFSSQAAHTSFCALEREEIIDLQGSLCPFIISENVSLPSGSLLARQNFFSLFDFFYVYLSCLYVYVYTMLRVQRSDDTWDIPSSNLQHVGPREEIQMARLGGKCLHLLNHLTSNLAFYSSLHLLLAMSRYFRVPLISLAHSYLPIIPLSTPSVQASPRTFREETGSQSFQNPVYAFIWKFATR